MEAAPRRMIPAATVLAAGCYSWLAAGTRPFSWGADLVTAGGFAAVFVVFTWGRVGRPPRARPDPPKPLETGSARGGLVTWLLLSGSVAAFELATLFLDDRENFPTLSSLYDSASHVRPLKAVIFLLWLLAGWGLFSR